MIEDYALIGDTLTCALVGRHGSIDWLCFPRVDSPACFSALLGGPEHGRWLLAPRGEIRRVERRYLEDTLVLETEMQTADGVVRLIDFMPIREDDADLVRIVEGVSGRVPMQLELVIRYDYGSVVPWVRREQDRLHAVAGPDAIVFTAPVPTTGRGLTTVADFVVERGDRLAFSLAWHPSHLPPPASPDAKKVLVDTCEYWREWSRRSHTHRLYHEPMQRSLITLKALTYRPSGGIVAAPTTSLPEQMGGVRNWDYRYCWLRDATFTLQALIQAGYTEEAAAWREWLVRTVAGEPAKLQILYGVTGERRIEERTLDWLPGFADSRPVRVGNAAVQQRQLDVYGEVMDALYLARDAGLDANDDAWAIQRACMDWLEGHWAEPDEGMWETRGGPQQFTLSKVMVWAAADRAVRTIERFGAEGPLDRWCDLRARVHEDVCAFGFDPQRGTFTQVYGGRDLDASLLLIPIVGFLSPHDPRVLGTIEAIQRELTIDGFVRRYPTGEHSNIDGLPGREGVFLACSFWLVDALVLANRRDEATALFERLLDLRNDVGLLAEEYEPYSRRFLGNFPQAFSHVALLNSARNLSTPRGPAEQRATRSHAAPLHGGSR